jgi:hypothetical protein
MVNSESWAFGVGDVGFQSSQNRNFSSVGFTVARLDFIGPGLKMEGQSREGVKA